MPTMEEYAKQPREQRIQRLTRTADELAAAIKGQSDAVLSRRPDATNWAAKEIVCHLRDAEEAFGTRFEQILAMDVDPTLSGPNADRVALERQYLRNDAGDALAAFRQRRKPRRSRLLPSSRPPSGRRVASIRSAAGSRWTASSLSWPGTTTITWTSSCARCRGERSWASGAPPRPGSPRRARPSVPTAA